MSNTSIWRRYFHAFKTRPFKICLRLFLKKIYQQTTRWKRRLQSSLHYHETSDRKLLRALRGTKDTATLINHFENREKPLFYCQHKDGQRLVKLLKTNYPASVRSTIEDADEVCSHIFNLLGSGKVNLGTNIDWHQDFKSGYRWPVKFYTDIIQVNLDDNSDVKVPRELSRCHHFVTLGKAYWYTYNEKYAREFVCQLMDWIENNPPRMGVNWCCTMDVAIRMVNWIWAYHFFVLSPHFNQERKLVFLKSILSHGEFIIENLEYFGEFSNNHYLSNIVGLVIVGILFPEFKQAKQWKKLGLKELFSEMKMQVHDDGVDFEGSVSYHRLVLEMFVSAVILCAKNDVRVPGHVWHRLEKMFEYVLYYTKPNGMSPQIGDTDNGRLQILGRNEVMDHRYLLSIGAVLFGRGDFKHGAGTFHEDALWLLGEEGFGTFHAIQGEVDPLTSRCFEEGGVYFMRKKDLYMAVDCGPNGRRGKGGHCHNDTLSFELYAHDKSFIVDPGTYCYTADPEWRNRFRSTAYHNTVVVDGQEMNRIVADQLFLLGNDASPKVNMWKPTPEADFLDAQHNGYERLTEPVTHRRHFYFDKGDNYWIIRDLVIGKGKHALSWYFHFHSGINLSINEVLIIETLCQDGANLIVQAIGAPGMKLEVNEGWVSPSYGVKTKAYVARYWWTGNLPLSVTFLLYPYRTPSRNRFFRIVKQQANDLEQIGMALV